MNENELDVAAITKLNRLIYLTIISSCLFSKIKYALYFCVFDFFCLKEKHCRSPPAYSFQKNEMNRRNKSAIRSR